MNDKNLIPLNTLSLGLKAKIKLLKSSGITRRRLLDLGLISDTVIEPLLKSPSGDPTAYYIRGTVIALRAEEASAVLVEQIQVQMI